jgi:hypothetical protein
MLECEMFQRVPLAQIATMAGAMDYRVFHRNDVILHQGEPSNRFFLLESGDVRRDNIDEENGRQRNVEFAIKAKSINSMRILSGEQVHSTVRCVSENCKVYEMQRAKFLDLLQKKPQISVKIAEGLCEQLRIGSKKYQTPLLEQKQQEINVPAVAIAAGIESYYRSALNALLNARLTGVKGSYFPNMHIQVPSRIAYITGFKSLRAYMDKHMDTEQYENRTAVQLVKTVAPGVIMTPLSSLLEASNAGHVNKEPMSSRWMRGTVPRAGREIVFGLGLNQLSDYFEERLSPMFPHHPVVANAAGSLVAGVCAGYFSHVPHNLSTYKLMEPHRSYGDLYAMFVDKSVPTSVDQMVQTWPASARTATRTVFATLFPRGVMIRTVQIVGSFMILNGTINYLQVREHLKIQRAMGL